MSRIGNKPINVPANVTVTIAEGNLVTVKGPLGELQNKFHSDMNIDLTDGVLKVSRPSDDKDHRTYHGTTRALLHNMVVGVSEGFKKELEIIGTGYRAAVQGNKVVVNVGHSHACELVIPAGIKVECPKPTQIVISGIDKETVGQVAAVIRGYRKPEPYHGKGVRYVDEHVRRKEGKKA